jgi:hypothetical protein
MCNQAATAVQHACFMSAVPAVMCAGPALLLTTKGFDTAGVTWSIATSCPPSPRRTASAMRANLPAVAPSNLAVSFLSAMNTSGRRARPPCSTQHTQQWQGQLADCDSLHPASLVSSRVFPVTHMPNTFITLGIASRHNVLGEATAIVATQQQCWPVYLTCRGTTTVPLIWALLAPVACRMGVPCSSHT